MKMYKKGYFFRAATPSSSYTTHTSDCCVQVPSIADLNEMHGMPAGLIEDQFQRLSNMTKVLEQIRKLNPALPIMTTDQVTLPVIWSKLFAEIRNGSEKDALALFSQIPARDPILQALLSAHPAEYLQEIIKYSVLSRQSQMLVLESEITITPGAFEILVKDIASTLFHSAAVHFSFGLPTHHAFSTGGSGFCILDKTAMLIKHKARTSNSPLKFMIVGTDINRDNGLSYDLMNSASELDICHVDVFDSRVYPGQDHEYINQEFELIGDDVGEEIKCWKRGHMQYFAVDLSQTQRGAARMHAALVFALQKVEEQIVRAKKERQKVMLILPTGWDSHQDETAPCGKYVNGKMMSKEEAVKTRFNDNDLTCFYEQIFELYHENKEHIMGIYWGLEGGYKRAMYEKQIQLLMSLVVDKLLLQSSSKNVLGGGL